MNGPLFALATAVLGIVALGIMGVVYTAGAVLASELASLASQWLRDHPRADRVVDMVGLGLVVIMLAALAALAGVIVLEAAGVVA